MQAFVTAGKKYIISTGGAAGAFRCDTDSAFLSFVQRYHSSAMVGVDFDIEAGQTQVGAGCQSQVWGRGQTQVREHVTACALGLHYDQGSGLGAGCPKRTHARACFLLEHVP